MAPLIEFSQVSVKYGKFEALKSVSFDIEPGMSALLGPNGAGKTTLIKALLGLIPIAKGEIRVLGTSASLFPLDVRQHVGYVPERESYLPGVSPIQFVTFIAELSGMDHRSALKRAHEVLEYTGLKEERYRKLETLSHGQQARVKLAQALCHNSKILLLDEPTDGMDPEGQENFLKLVSKIQKESSISVLLCTHSLEIAESLCEKVIFLCKGEVICSKDISQIRNDITKAYLLRLAKGSEAFVQNCKEQNIHIQERDSSQEFLVEGMDDSKVLFQIACKSNACILSLVPWKLRLEEIFVQMLQSHSESHKTNV